MRPFDMSHTALALAVAASVSASVAVKAQNPAEPAPPVGLASNGLIAFGSGSDIWIAEPDGSDPRQLTSGPALESMPYWSPDGTRLAYWSQVERSAPSQLIVVNVDGTEPTTITTHADGQLPIRTDWSPDGTRLAYSICPDGTGNACSTERVLVAAADGSGSQQVGDPELGAANPDWSPDSLWIAFGGRSEGGSEGPYVMAADGSDVRRLEQLPDGEGPFAYFVDWEPGGSGIVTQGSESVYVVTAADDAATALAPGGIAFWSPDGAWVAYLQDMSRFALVSSDGAEAVDLLVDRPGGFVWSPDATRLVVFTGSGYADTSLDILDAATGEVLAEIPAPGDGYPGHYHYPSWQRVAP